MKNFFQPRIKKILKLVRCPACKRAYYIDILELIKIPFTSSEYYKNECKLCGKPVKLEIIEDEQK